MRNSRQMKATNIEPYNGRHRNMQDTNQRLIVEMPVKKSNKQQMGILMSQCASGKSVDRHLLVPI